MKTFEEMDYHPTSEKLVEILRDHTQRDDSLFFRLLVGYYFSLAASQMRCVIKTPDRGDIPTNMYVLNLAPSGYGKTMSMNLLEEQVLHQFRQKFLNETFPILAEQNITTLANKKAIRKGTDPDGELALLSKVFSRMGPPLFSFDSGTQPAVKQMRNLLLMGSAGSLNLIMDEVGNNLSANMEVFDTFIELFDKGMIKQKLLKNTNESARDEEILGKTPANLLMFGVPNKLFDGNKTEDDLMSMLESGYSRRCFFGYIRSSSRRDLTPEEMFKARTNKANNTYLDQLADRLENLADIINANKELTISDETCVLLYQYQKLCEERARKFLPHQELQIRELEERNFKVLKLAGAYAFIDDVPEVTAEHVYNAIKLAEDSGEAFTLMLARDKPWVKLAKYIASIGNDVTHADLAEDLPFYKGSSSYKQELLTLATAYGYKNNIIVKKSFVDGIEFLRGETLKQTDLARMIVSYSTDITTGYVNEHAPFDQLHKLTQAANENGNPMHWVAHHLSNGYRNEENAIPGFSMVVIDVDGGTTIETAKRLLSSYKFLLYTTKSHSEQEHCFRIAMPTNYELRLDAKDYREFMHNIFEWLPFEVDTATGQRARKWLSNPGHYEYNEGDLLDALPFIPKTSKNEERKQLLNSQQSLDNLERWMLNHTGDGNRNNMLYRYAIALVDGGLGLEAVRQKVVNLNNKLSDPLDEVEIMKTVMLSMTKEMTKR
jgi:hypothetical protein